MALSESALLDDKSQLRHTMRARRDAVAATDRARWSNEACARLLSLPELVAARALSGFLAIGSEIDPAQALHDLRQRGVRVAYPRVTTERPRLRFHVADPACDMRPGPFHLQEPAPTTPEVPLDDLDVVLMPGLAFDEAGQRLGYGRGYYDEVAATIRSAHETFSARRTFFVGVSFDFQVVERCPAGMTDFPADCIVTDRRVIRCEPFAATNTDPKRYEQ